MSDNREAVLRQQAENRRTRLLNRGSERIQQIQSGHHATDSFQSECPAASIDESEFPESVSFEDGQLPMDPQTLFAALGLPLPDGSGSTMPAPTPPFDEAFACRLERSKKVEGVRSPLVLLIGCLAVVVSTVLGKYSRDGDGEYNYFFKMNGICCSTFCCLEIAIQIFIVSWSEAASSSAFLNLGLLLPILQLVMQFGSGKQLIAFAVVGISIVGVYFWQKIQTQGFPFQRLLELCLSNSMQLIHSFTAAKAYVADYAIFCVANAACILLVSLLGRCFGV